jgi:NADH dehydrogenase FAD-containing subunit
VVCAAARSGGAPDGNLALHNILAQMKGKPLKAYVYKDHGSLVSLSTSLPSAA